MKRIALPVLMFYIAVQLTFAQNVPQKSLDAVRDLADSMSFVFDANRASPLGLPSISIVAIDNYLRIQKDSTTGFLPYFGEMRLGGGYGEEGAIKFSSEIRDYQVKTKSSGKAVIVTFTCKNAIEQFNFTLYITRSKSTTVVVQSLHRNSITYYGVIRELSENSLE